MLTSSTWLHRRWRRVGAVAALTALTACGGETGTYVPAALAAEVAFVNGKIATGNARNDIVQAVAVRGGRIIAAGTNDDVRAVSAPQTRSVDLGGRTVLPGFHDNHVHLNLGAVPDPHYVDLWEATSVAEVVSAVAATAAKLAEGEWIRVDLPYTTAFPHPFPEEALPTRADLDRAAPNHPVYLTRGAYLTVVNTLALRKAGISPSTRTPGGVIDRDERGELTGKLRGGQPRRLVTAVMPPIPSPDRDASMAALRRFLEGLLGLGITSVNAAGIDLTRADQWRTIQDVYERWGAQLPRLIVQPRIQPGYDRFDDPLAGVSTIIRELEATPYYTGWGNDRLKIGAIKIMIDGAFSGPNAWTLGEYPGRPGFHGSLRVPEEALYPVVKRAHELGWQLGVHAIGDAAIQLLVDVFDRVQQEHPRQNARHYIHHFTMMPPAATLAKMKRWDIGVASQPNWTYSKMQFIQQGLSGAALERAEPQKSVLDQGLHLSYGSDGMPYGPLLGIDCAVTRIGGDGQVRGPEERVTLAQAIRSYTFETAYLNFEERDQGSLEVGKTADLVVLSSDIFSAAPGTIRTIGIEKTFIAGEEVFATDRPSKPWQNLRHPWTSLGAPPHADKMRPVKAKM